MNSKRIKEIQAETAYPQSRSVQQALLKVWNECEQKQDKNFYNKEDLWESYKASNTIFEDEIALRQEFEEWFEEFKRNNL